MTDTPIQKLKYVRSTNLAHKYDYVRSTNIAQQSDYVQNRWLAICSISLFSGDLRGIRNNCTDFPLSIWLVYNIRISKWKMWSLPQKRRRVFSIVSGAQCADLLANSGGCDCELYLPQVLDRTPCDSVVLWRCHLHERNHPALKPN